MTMNQFNKIFYFFVSKLSNISNKVTACEMPLHMFKFKIKFRLFDTKLMESFLQTVVALADAT